MSIPAALTITGAFLLYPTLLALGKKHPGSAPQALLRKAAGTVAALAGLALMVSSRGFGVGLSAFLFLLTLALSGLALAAPLWPRPTQYAVGLTLAALLANALRGA